MKVAASTIRTVEKKGGLDEYLGKQGVKGISEVDTRSITRRIRSQGAMMGCITSELSADQALEHLRSAKRYVDLDHVASVTTQQTYDWGLNPKDSRLMHGTGMYAMFQLMAKLLDKCSQNPDIDECEKHLQLVAPYCHWTEEDGDWTNIDGFGQNIVWNGLENTAMGKNILTAFLLRTYIQEFQNARW